MLCDTGAMHSITCLPAQSLASSHPRRPPLGTRAAGAGAFSRFSLDQLALTQFEGAEAMVSSALGKRQNTLGHQEAA